MPKKILRTHHLRVIKFEFTYSIGRRATTFIAFICRSPNHHEAIGPLKGKFLMGPIAMETTQGCRFLTVRLFVQWYVRYAVNLHNIHVQIAATDQATTHVLKDDVEGSLLEGFLPSACDASNSLSFRFLSKHTLFFPKACHRNRSGWMMDNNQMYYLDG